MPKRFFIVDPKTAAAAFGVIRFIDGIASTCTFWWTVSLYETQCAKQALSVSPCRHLCLDCMMIWGTREVTHLGHQQKKYWKRTCFAAHHRSLTNLCFVTLELSYHPSKDIMNNTINVESCKLGNKMIVFLKAFSSLDLAGRIQLKLKLTSMSVFLIT